ncbi:LOW QUALITY PROTEIN: probable LRR receptor-like serine/threonine-protein kinase At4g29180 [Chenopodium quinoa]|uniref:LOW QUALITY PROTEIN: probable LRR receptor-like serine/threonine-protein kinase At4g29180 n=1 Tax=Chenopodium quinoa TaxID=63459 RepID=UPI000B798435|nr:LOW QUALITY PROTEIN: probable LRR receptor-like serine/threonine-protein kinase At4g29180 [Chenopodium quinoa]
MLKLNTCIIRLVLFLGTTATTVIAATKPHGIHHYRHQRRHLTDARDVTGFISIDCGTNASYTDSSTALYYTTDEQYIDSGINMDILPEHKIENLQQQLTNVRSFPEGTKNCYTLKPSQGKGRNYLIRAYFLYGNYDSLNKPPTFDLLLGVDVWSTVKLDNSSHYVWKEIIHTPSTDYLYVCVANTDSGTPFISGLELRLLPDSIYKQDSGSLDLLCRNYVTNLLNFNVIRYKDDVYDRIWKPGYPTSQASFIETMSEVGPGGYLLPSSVMKVAVVPKILNQPIRLYYNQESDRSTGFYFFLHVAEISELPKGEVRELSITLNGVKKTQDLYTPYLQTKTISNDQKPITDSFLNITIQSTNNSTLPPILNAIEVFNVIQISELSTDVADVHALNQIKSFYKRMTDWQGDPCFPKRYSWAGVVCNYDSSNIIRITSVNLSSKGLTGHIAASFADLTSLQILDLSDNNLSGLIPELLADLPMLKTLNLSKNNFTGSVPELLLEKSAAGALSLSVENISGLCSSRSCTSKKKSKAYLAYIAAISALLVLLVAGFIIFCIYKRHTARLYERSRNGKRKGEFTRFSNSELTSITKNRRRELGKGGFGVVYYGRLNDGTEVAVKILSQSIHASDQFTTEVELLMDIRHKNLVSLIGYCEEETTLALVYEYMAGGNLQSNLSASKPLSWKLRLQIALDSAQGLEYLHNGCSPPVVHRDVKTQNILLDKNLQAKIADFGMSKIFPDEPRTHVSTRVIGTPGYLDPQYHETRQLKEKSDVYSFGVVLLELITGKEATVNIQEKVITLVQWVIPILETGDLREILDERLQEVQNTNSVWRVIDIAMACVKRTAMERPTMSQIVTDLKECLAMVLNTEHDTTVPDDSTESLVTANTELDTTVHDDSTESLVTTNTEMAPEVR